MFGLLMLLCCQGDGSKLPDIDDEVAHAEIEKHYFLLPDGSTYLYVKVTTYGTPPYIWKYKNGGMTDPLSKWTYGLGEQELKKFSDGLKYGARLSKSFSASSGWEPAGKDHGVRYHHMSCVGAIENLRPGLPSFSVYVRDNPFKQPAGTSVEKVEPARFKQP